MRRVPLTLSYLVLCISTAGAADIPHHRLRVALSETSPQIRGSIESTFTNTSSVPLNELVLMLFPNRFATPDTGVNDWNRQFVYPGLDFEPGWIDVGAISIDGSGVVPAVPAVSEHQSPPRVERESQTAGTAGPTVLRLPLSVPLMPGQSLSLRAEFATHVPSRFGSFGEFQGMITALGGWYPSIPSLHADGTWGVGEAPPLADFDVEVGAETRLDVVLNGRLLPHLEAPAQVSVAHVHYLTLLASPEFLVETMPTPDGRVLYLRRPPVRTDRISPGPAQLEITSDALARILEKRPPGVPAPTEDLVVVEAPLRMNMAAPGEGMVVISDRSMKVVWMLRPFQEEAIARAVHAELLRPRLAAREPDADYVWVEEGTAHRTGRLYYDETQVGTRSVRGWIELFDVFAIVDRFETVPKIPFVGVFFDQETSPDPLHQQITSWNNDLPPGHVVLSKLRQQLGKEEFDRVFAACLDSSLPFRRCAAVESGRDLDPFFAEWLQPYPQINYSFADVDLNQAAGAEYVDEVTVRRESSRPIHEPVQVELRSIGGERVNLRWDGSGDEARLTVRAPFRVQQAVIDPNRELMETTRADNAQPPEPQIILDTAEVEVSSTEFGISGLVVGRGRYDYRKDLAVAGVYSNRSLGAAFGGRYHWGEPIDPAAYRNNLYVFYSIQALDKSFHNDQQPDVRTSGHVNGLGVRYDYDNILYYDNPTHEVQLQLFADWYGSALASDYDFVDWGGSLVMTHPLWSYRTILAGQIVNGFSEPLGSSTVPNQSLYSLGGSRSIRGIGAEEELARNIFVLRAEVRHTIYEELDLNFLDLLVLRHLQVRPFVDTGEVSNSAGHIYNPEHFAVGVGMGFGVLYDVMGFFPSVAYLEFATRVDEPGSLQVLFGTRQSF